MANDAGPEFDGPLRIVLQFLLAVIRDQEAEVAASQRAAGDWERRAVLGTATVANQLGLRVREAEVRERRLRRQLAELVAADRTSDELRGGLVRILNDVS
jgi:hypothetical protein